MTLEQKKQVIRASTGLINRYIFDRTVALAIHNDRGIHGHGTGILMLMNGHPIVITAAHVIKNTPPGMIQIISTEAPSNDRFAPDSGELYGGGVNDELDVGFLRLGDSAAPLLDGKRFLTLNDFDIFPHGLTTDLAILYGMPGELRKERLPNVHSFRSFGFMTRFSGDVDWSAPGHRPTVTLVNYAESVEDSFSSNEVFLPDPHGMSGGGLWRANFAGAAIWTPERLRLVGIITEYDDEVHEVYANRVENFYHLLSEHFDLPEIP
jgi:hypothetical protein